MRDHFACAHGHPRGAGPRCMASWDDGGAGRTRGRDIAQCRGEVEESAGRGGRAAARAVVAEGDKGDKGHKCYTCAIVLPGYRYRYIPGIIPVTQRNAAHARSEAATPQK